MLTILPLTGMPEITSGNPLGQLLADALAPHLAEPAFMPGDMLVVTQKIVSKAEGRFRRLSDVVPGDDAHDLARKTSKDPRLVALVLEESSAVVRAAPGVLITRHHLGHVMANAGIDSSNVGGSDADSVLLLPQDPDASAGQIRAQLLQIFGSAPAVVISDSFGRPWRHGVTQVAIGASGCPALIDRRGDMDRDGRVLQVTQIGVADMAACAAGLVMGETAEGIPAALLRGLDWGNAPDSSAAEIVRPIEQDLFR